MKAPVFMTPEDGWDQLTLPAPFGDERKELDVFCKQKPEATVYVIYIDGLEMGELVYSGQWLALRGNLLTAKEISILTPVIMESTMKPPEPPVMTDDEKRLREWLTANEVYPGEPDMQAMVINSFHAEENEEFDADDLIPFDEIDFDKFDLNTSFEQESKSDENDEQEWQEKVKYALDNLDKFPALYQCGVAMMQSMNYFLLPDAERGIIVHGPTGTRLNVYRLENEDFRPLKGELYIFGDDHGEWLAFETEGWNGGDIQVFSGAVLWYAVYLDYPAMDITTEDPRPEFKLRKL